MSRNAEFRNSRSRGARPGSDLEFRVSDFLAWLAIFGTVCALAISYVYLRNLHVRKGDEIRDLEGKIANLEAEVEMYELRIARLMNRERLEASLAAKEGLRPIAPEQVLVIEPEMMDLRKR